jgi:hypothetical protein
MIWYLSDIYFVKMTTMEVKILHAMSSSYTGTIAFDACISELQEKINTHLKAGWKLQGSMCISIASDHYMYMSASQMVISEKSDRTI